MKSAPCELLAPRLSDAFEEKFHLRRPFPDGPANSFVYLAADIINLFASATKKLCRVMSDMAGREPRLLINGVNQSERFLVRQNRLLHLIHDVGETDFVF
jgi:hypothetical protein